MDKMINSNFQRLQALELELFKAVGNPAEDYDAEAAYYHGNAAMLLRRPAQEINSLSWDEISEIVFA